MSVVYKFLLSHSSGCSYSLGRNIVIGDSVEVVEDRNYVLSKLYHGITIRLYCYPEIWSFGETELVSGDVRSFVLK